MKVSTKNIKLIRERLDYLYEHFNIIPSSDQLSIGDETIKIKFPHEDNYLYYPVDFFLEYTEDLENIKTIEDHSVICGNIRHTIVDMSINIFFPLVFDTPDYTLHVIKCPFLIGIIASQNDKNSKKFRIYPCSKYTAIEFIYKKDINEEECIRHIKACLFYIANNYNLAISIGKFRSWCEVSYEVPKYDPITEDKLIPYINIMDSYIKALFINNEEIKYLHLYKIIEYFSPIVSKKTAYEQLNKKLDALQIIERDSEYLDSIFKLTKQYEVSLKDKELAYTVLDECIDISNVFKFLPSEKQKNISKICHFNIKDILGLQSEEIKKIKKEIGSILYNTRNSIVHAKSNYTPKGNECSNEELVELNEFISMVCKCLFIWNSRQPKEFKVK